MRRNLSLLGLSLSLGALLWPLPASHSVAAGFAVPKFGRADAAMDQSERPSATRLTAWLQGVRPRVCRHTAVSGDALATTTVGFPGAAFTHLFRQPVEAGFGHLSAGARSLFPRAPPLSA